MMNTTPGYIKAFVDVSYTTKDGIKQHMMSFQLATGRNDVDGDVDRVTQRKLACEADPSKMQDYIKAAIATAEANDYQITLDFGLSC